MISLSQTLYVTSSITKFIATKEEKNTIDYQWKEITCLIEDKIKQKSFYISLNCLDAILKLIIFENSFLKLED